VRYLPRFFEILDWALKPQAAAVMVATCQPENRFTVLQANDYARVFQWPNSFCFSATYLLNVVEKTTRGSLVTESIDNWSHREDQSKPDNVTRKLTCHKHRLSPYSS
jgi:cyclopropane-fatty-acyl-phospholipid synthase